MTHRPTRTATTLLALTGTLAGIIALATTALTGPASPAHADPLCDQMRAQYGAGWPCINVPTYTPPPTQNTPPPTTGGNNPGSTGGPGIAGNPGPGPGQGNGTPIVPVPGQPSQQAPRPPQPPAGTAPTRVPQPPNTPPGNNPDLPTPSVPQPVAPPTDAIIDDADEPAVPTGTTPPATTDTDGERGSIPLAIWILAGAGAVAASYPRTRARTTTRTAPASASPAAGMYRTVGAVVPRPQQPTDPGQNTNNSPAETPGTAAPSGQGGGDQATTPSYEPSDDSSYGGDSGYGGGYSGGGYGGESSGGGGQGQGTSTSPPVTPLDNKQDPPPQAFNPGSDSASELKTIAAVLSNLLGLIPAIGQFFYLWFQSLFGDRHPVPMPKLGDVDVDKLIRDLLTALMRDPAAVERAIRQAIADATLEQREQLRQLWSQITDNLDRIDDPDIREQLRQAIDRYGPVLEDALLDPQQPLRPTMPSDSPDPESPSEPRQPGDTPDSPDSPRQPGDLPDQPPTEAPDQPTPPGELPNPDTSPDPGPDEPIRPGDTPNPDNGPTAPGDLPPSPPEPDTPQTPDTPETPGEPSTPGEVPDHTPPDWWQPTTPPDPDTPDFRHPPDPDYAPPPGSSQKEGDGAGQASPDGDWFGRIFDQLTPPEQDPESPNVQPTPPDERTPREQLRDTYGVDQADPPSKGDPLYAFYMQLTAYQRSFWEATGWTPLGKQIHHAIEQIVWRDYPGVFSPETKHSGENTRGIWGADAPKLHQSAIRRAWDAIYDALEGWGVLPAPQTMDGSAAQLAREGLLFGAFLIDVLFGDKMVPNPDIVTSGDLETILLDLGLSADQVSRFSETDLDDRLRLLQMILDGWTGDLGPYSDYSGIGE